ncbi:MAG: hypothetical protein Q8O35_12175 [Humidesulfovibrio sp.]|uniref:TIGR03943 family putative permease subunit n=1 Tax=Humidesulfovibrio sp. TaxID=2910988 RepID=UPI002763BC2E|nr:hypothetical protein [Humidesulfovibrio sp.]
MSLADFRANFQVRVQDRVDGLCLLSLGGLMFALARSGLYWYFLNPRFSTITLAAGALLALTGLVLIVRPAPGKPTTARLCRQAVLLGFLSLAATSWGQAASEPLPGAMSPAASDNIGAAPEAETTVDPRPIKNGSAYLRLNLAELYIMLDKGRTDYPPRFALRAVVVRTPELDARGYVLLKRTAMVCCLADSMELSFVTRGPDLDALQTGDWVEVFGRLEPLDVWDDGKGADQGLVKATPKSEGPSLSLTNPKLRIQAEAVTPIQMPAFPYLFEFREQEPFAW